MDEHITPFGRYSQDIFGVASFLATPFIIKIERNLTIDVESIRKWLKFYVCQEERLSWSVYVDAISKKRAWRCCVKTLSVTIALIQANVYLV